MRIYQLEIFVLAILVLTAVLNSGAQGMMSRDGGMMGREHHREMMQRMMGDMLPPPMDPADLPDPNTAGAQLLQRFCTQCHYLYGLGLHTAGEWPAVVERMNRRMQMMAGHHMMVGTIEAPSPEQLATITGYLQEHAQQPLPAARQSELQQTEGGRLFSSVCSRCHPLPDPDQYTTKEWPAVIERMQRYMTESGQELPGEQEMQKIVQFLQKNSAAEPLPESKGEKP